MYKPCWTYSKMDLDQGHCNGTQRTTHPLLSCALLYMPVPANPGLRPRKDPLFEPLLLSFLFHCTSAMWCARCALRFCLQNLMHRFRFRERWFVGLTSLLSRELLICGPNTVYFSSCCRQYVIWWGVKCVSSQNTLQSWDRPSQRPH